MSQPQFEITIAKDGKVTVTVKGASGRECLELSDMLREIIGHEDSRRLTSEYYGPDGTVCIDVEVRQETPGH